MTSKLLQAERNGEPVRAVQASFAVIGLVASLSLWWVVRGALPAGETGAHLA